MWGVHSFRKNKKSNPLKKKGAQKKISLVRMLANGQPCGTNQKIKEDINRRTERHVRCHFQQWDFQLKLINTEGKWSSFDTHNTNKSIRSCSLIAKPPTKIGENKSVNGSRPCTGAWPSYPYLFTYRALGGACDKNKRRTRPRPFSYSYQKEWKKYYLFILQSFSVWRAILQKRKDIQELHTEWFQAILQRMANL